MSRLSAWREFELELSIEHAVSLMQNALAKELISGLKGANVRVVAWLPDTMLGPAAAELEKENCFVSVQVTNEAEGLAVCSGAWLSGARPCLLMENTGLLVALHNIEYVSMYYGIPVLLIISFRGAIGDGVWWFSGVGQRTEPALRLHQIQYEVIENIERLGPAIADAVRSMENSKRPVALLVKKSVTA